MKIPIKQVSSEDRVYVRLEVPSVAPWENSLSDAFESIVSQPFAPRKANPDYRQSLQDTIGNAIYHFEIILEDFRQLEQELEDQDNACR